MKSHICLLAALISAALTVNPPPPLRAESVRIGVTGGVTFIPFWAGKDRGIFRKNGLEVEIITIQGGTLAVQALLAGSIPFAGLGQAYLRGAVKGADMVMVMTYMDRFPYSLLVKPGISRPEHLKGRTLAVSRFGSAADFASRVALQHLGVNPEKDVTLIQVGNEPSRFAALKAGTVDGTIVSAPLTGVGHRLGFKSLFRMRDLGVLYPHEGVVVTRRYANENRATVSRFVRSVVESIHALKTDRELAISLMAKHLKIDPVENRGVLEDSYQEIVIDEYVKDPRPSLEGIKFMLEVLRKTETGKMSMDPRDYVDMSFMEELNKSGFIASLYKEPAKR